MKTRDDIINQIIQYFKENDDVFTDCIEQLDNYNGYLTDDRYFYMEDLNEFYRDSEPIELLYRVFYGYDADNWYTTKEGERINREFNPNREYFYYNGYGNLVSSDYKDYSAHLDHYIIDEFLENIDEIYSIDDNDELKELFDELAQLDEQED